MYNKNVIIAGLIALSLHAALIMLSPNVTSEPKVIFRKGESSLKMKLVPSVASTASTKSVIDKQDSVQKVKKIDKPMPFPKPEEKKETQMKIEDSIEKTEKEINYSAEHFMAQKEIDRKQQKTQKTNANAHDSKEITADVKAKGVIEGAMIKNVLKPSYPSSCKRQGHEGTTVLKVTILSKGKCGNIDVIQSAGCKSLDKAAIKALKKARYIPAKQLGVAYTTTKKIAFNFKLEDYR